MTRRKFQRAGIGALILVILTGIDFAIAPRLVGWFAIREHPEVASEPAPSPLALPQVAQAAQEPPASPFVPRETEAGASAPLQNAASSAPVAVAPSAAESPPGAVSEQALAPAPNGALASRTYEGIRFVLSVTTEGNNLKLLVAATDAQKRNAKFQFFSTDSSQAIDDRGDSSVEHQVRGVPSCRTHLDSCTGRNGEWWSMLYADNPLLIILQFSGTSRDPV
jgi:hypothetical protein